MPEFDHGITFLEKKGRKMAKNTKLSIAFYEKYLMTVEEAAVFFPTRGICITDALLATLVFCNYEAGAWHASDNCN